MKLNHKARIILDRSFGALAAQRQVVAHEQAAEAQLATDCDDLLEAFGLDPKLVHEIAPDGTVKSITVEEAQLKAQEARFGPRPINTRPAPWNGEPVEEAPDAPTDPD